MDANAVVIITIVCALAFDVINGFHDAANSIATVVSTRVLSPRYAVMWAAFFNFIAFLFFGLHVANTIGKGIVDPAVVDPAVIFAALVGAIAWDLITWFYGIPSSSSHALIGGLAGAAVAKAGASSLDAAGLTKVTVSIVLSPRPSSRGTSLSPLNSRPSTCSAACPAACRAAARDWRRCA